MEFLDELTLTGATVIVGVEAKMKVLLTEKAPFPLFDVTLTLYYTSSVPESPL
jgi:hypothetical protein